MALEPVPAMPPLVVVAHYDPAIADSLRHAVETVVGWQVVLADPSAAGLAAAVASEPSVALIGCDALADLPSGCPTPLIAIGDDERPADIRAALATGARSLLAWPDGAADLPGELARVAALGHHEADQGGGLVVAARGVQGGAGTTTVAVHLAAAWARWGPAPVLLVDLAGGLAFRLDLGGAPTWSELTRAVQPGLPADPGLPAGSELPAGSRLSVGSGLPAGSEPPADPGLPVGSGLPAGSELSADPGLPVGSEPPVDPGRPVGRHVLDLAVQAMPGDAADRPPPADAPSGSAAYGVVGIVDPGHAAAGCLHPEAAGEWPHAADRTTAVTGWSLDAGDLVRAVTEPWPGLAVLPLAGLADGVPDPPPDPLTVQAVLEAARTAYRLVVLDLPAADGTAIRTALSLADALVAVGRCETAGVRGLQTALESWAAAGRDPEAAGAVVTGVRPQAPLAAREVRAILGDRLWGLIPAAAAELAAAAEDGVLLIDRHDLPAIQAMVTLANRVVPFAAVSA